VPIAAWWGFTLANAQPQAWRGLVHGRALAAVVLGALFALGLALALAAAWRARAPGGPVAGSTRRALVAASALALCLYLTGGIVREQARGPYDVYGVMGSGEAVQPYESPRSPFP
jgi:cytochrome bd-type quinol oxidase subunit 1